MTYEYLFRISTISQIQVKGENEGRIYIEGREGRKTYATIPPIVITTPNALPSLTLLPPITHPILTIEIVLRCPTTVLLTGPEEATMKNWEMFIREAKAPDMRILELGLITTFRKLT